MILVVIRSWSDDNQNDDDAGDNGDDDGDDDANDDDCTFASSKTIQDSTACYTVTHHCTNIQGHSARNQSKNIHIVSYQKYFPRMIKNVVQRVLIFF